MAASNETVEHDNYGEYRELTEVVLPKIYLNDGQFIEQVVLESRTESTKNCKRLNNKKK